MTDFDNLTTNDLIAQFVLLCRGQGSILPYEDYPIINAWLEKAKNADILLIALEEKLPEYYRKYKKGHHLPTLRGLQTSINKRIEELLVN